MSGSGEQPDVSYVPGADMAVVGLEAIALLPADTEPRIVREVLGALAPGAGVADVLQVLTGEFAASLARIPPFALAVVSASGVHAVVRGAFEVQLGTETVSGAGVSTWTERFVAGAGDVELRAAGSPTGESWPIAGGVVRASSVRRSGAVVEGARGSTADKAEAPRSGWTEPEPSAARTTEPEPPAGQIGEPALAEPAGVEETVVPSETMLPPEVEDGAAFDELWGSTVLRPVEQAAVRADEPEPDDEPLAPAAPSPRRAEPAAREPEPSAPARGEPMPSEPASSEPASSGQVPSEPAADRPTSVSAASEPAPPDRAEPATPAWTPPFMIDVPTPEPTPEPTAEPTPAAPSSLEPEDETVPAAELLAEPGLLGDHDGETVLRGQFAVVAPEVGETTGSVGRLRLSTGQVIELDRPVVLGRKPRVSRVGGAAVPRLVSVPSPEQDISRSHLEIRLEGVSVLVVDLGSTNGSTLLRPGQLPVRLHPNEAVLVVDGDVVDLGEGITVAFEGLA